MTVIGGGMHTGEFIDEGNISSDYVHRIFINYEIRSSLSDDESIWIETESKIPINVELDKFRKLIKFQSFVGVNRKLNDTHKFCFVNELNGHSQIKFFIKSGLLFGDYWIVYKGGVAEFQVIHAYKTFYRLFMETIRSAYKVDGVLDKCLNSGIIMNYQ